MNKNYLTMLTLVCLIAMHWIATQSLADGPRFRVSVSNSIEARQPLDGRLLLMISTNDDAEPRFQISDRFDSQQIIGVDVENRQAGEAMVVDATAFGSTAHFVWMK